MARFADLIGTTNSTAPVSPLEAPPEAPLGAPAPAEVHAGVMDAMHELCGTAPDPTDALAAAFGTDAPAATLRTVTDDEVSDFVVSDDDLLPIRTAGRRRRG